MKHAALDDRAAPRDGGLALRARWLLRREKALKGGSLALLDYGCGTGDLARVLAGLGGHAVFAGCDVSTRTNFADGQFDIVVASAALHHVSPAERKAVYAELGRVLKPGGRLYVFEHNPRNPLVRHVVARTPIDKNAILLDANEVQHGLLDTARYEVETDYLMFMPPAITFLRPVDRALAWLPLGAQYAVTARKPA